jgi:5-methylcytosine-specific restriction endonuclease McrA
MSPAQRRASQGGAGEVAVGECAVTLSDPGFLSMDDLWKKHIREAPREEVERRIWIEQEVCDAIRRAHRRHNHMTAVKVSVLVAKCMSCVYDETKWTQGLGLPSVYGEDFAKDFARLGFSRLQIQAIKRGIDDGSWHLRCHWCGSLIDIIGEGFAVRRTDLTEYFGFERHSGKRPPKWMKRLVLRMFGMKCKGCRKRLTAGKVTFDHIVPRSRGGLTEIGNLQPLCQKCATSKGNRDPDVEDVTLNFPLRPRPTDAYEGAIW